MFKMINQFGNKFTCEESDVRRYLNFKSKFENDREEAKYLRATTGQVENVQEVEFKKVEEEKTFEDIPEFKQD